MIIKITSKLKGIDGYFCFGYVDEKGIYHHYFDEFPENKKKL